LRHHRLATEEVPWAPLNGHGIRFFVEKVEYYDEGGNICALTNTPANPSDLSDWASFPDKPLPTDENGMVTAVLTVKNRPNLKSVRMVAYDWRLWKESASVPAPLSVLTVAPQGKQEEGDERNVRPGTKDEEGG